ncbi:MAG: ferric reductase-like transmembrane domain-containing protein [Chloroflexota bacterium]
MKIPQKYLTKNWLWLVVNVIAILLFLWTLWRLWTAPFGDRPSLFSINSIRDIGLFTGKTALVMLVLSFACTPIARLFKWNKAITVRKSLGLWGFGFAGIHMFITMTGTAFLSDLEAWQTIGRTMQDGWQSGPWNGYYAFGKMPYAVLGYFALVLLVPLALTSNRYSMRLLGKNWKRVHWLVYLVVPLAIWHYLWVGTHRAKWGLPSGEAAEGMTQPLLFAGIVGHLLLLRIPAIRKRISLSLLSVVILLWLPGCQTTSSIFGTNGSVSIPISTLDVEQNILDPDESLAILAATSTPKPNQSDARLTPTSAHKAATVRATLFQTPERLASKPSLPAHTDSVPTVAPYPTPLLIRNNIVVDPPKLDEAALFGRSIKALKESISHPNISLTLPRDLCLGKNNWYQCAQKIESYLLGAGDSNFVWTETSLEIPLKNGTAILLTDQIGRGAGGYAYYNYVRYMSEIGYHLVHVQYYEGSDYILFDEEIGNATVIEGVPVLAPDNIHFLLAVGRFESPLIIQLWTTGGDAPRMIEQWSIISNPDLVHSTFRTITWLSSTEFQIESEIVNVNATASDDLGTGFLAGIREKMQAVAGNSPLYHTGIFTGKREAEGWWYLSFNEQRIQGLSAAIKSTTATSNRTIDEQMDDPMSIPVEVLRRVGQNTSLYTCPECVEQGLSMTTGNGTGNAKPIEHSIPDNLCQSQYNRLDCVNAIEQYQFAEGVPGVDRQNQTLRIALPNGRVMNFTDSADRRDAHSALFRYMGYRADVSYHVVTTLLYEGGDFLLIDGASGEWMTFASMPIFAPGGKHFALETSAFDNPLRIQIWQRENDIVSLNTEFEIVERAREISYSKRKAEWLSPDRLQLTIEPRDVEAGSGEVAAATTQIFQAIPENDRWTAIWNGTPASMPPVHEGSIHLQSRRGFQVDTLDVGKHIYTDREYVVEVLSPDLIGATFFPFANNATRNTEPEYIRFDLLQPSTLYVAIDEQTLQLPGWMDTEWQLSEKELVTNDIPVHLYERHFEPGQIVLGGNWMPPAEGIRAHYLLMISPKSHNQKRSGLD